MHSYLNISKDLARAVVPGESVVAQGGIPCSVTQGNSRLYRVSWLSRDTSCSPSGQRSTCSHSMGWTLCQEVRRELLAERNTRPWPRLCQMPSIGPIRASVALSIDLLMNCLESMNRFGLRALIPRGNIGTGPYGTYVLLTE